ncbi:MAG: preprotein translocase subunit SecY [OCS116 cluster bacterium]|uniref:Protein translocase subunit SecY n=1 Tax=OCS116 cluster bacterium TaxID=2030921 RepID=A0A2A4Z665_9PROT|nr:preprotein translocase subunit SecY [OCS116 cluster bacterium]
MASAAEQLAANLNFSAFGKAEDLKKRIWFTLGALLVYRMGTFIPIPGIDAAALAGAFSNNQSGLLGVLDMFAGGAVGRMAIFALNVIPYITASIIIQLMTSMVPALAALKKEGASGQKKITQYTRYGAVFLAAIQGYTLAASLEASPGLVINPGLMFEVSTVITIVGGVLFLMWLGEQITARGIGNGVSLIIFSGIVANIPVGLVQMLQLGQQGTISTFLIIGILILSVLVIAFIVFVERAQRKLLVQYPKRQMNNQMYGGESSHLPLKLNTAGVIPPIFATALLMIPVTISNFAGTSDNEIIATVSALLGRGQPLYLLVFIVLIVFFAFYQTSVAMDPTDTADNLKKQGGFIPGIRPGARTAEYIDFVLTRITVLGAAFLVAVCILPEILQSQFALPFYFGGTSLLIVVSVTMDTVQQIQSRLLAHQYEGLVKKSKLRGKRKR